MKFQYKVQPIGTFERNNKDFDTDLVAKILNSIGFAGYELVCVSDGYAYFKKEVKQELPEMPFKPIDAH